MSRWSKQRARERSDDSEDAHLARAFAAMPWLEGVCADLEGLGWTRQFANFNPSEARAWLTWSPSLKLRQRHRIDKDVVLLAYGKAFGPSMAEVVQNLSSDPSFGVDPRLVLLADDRPMLSERIAALPRWQGIVPVVPGRAHLLEAQLASILRPSDPFDLRVPVVGAELVGRDDDLLQLIADLREHPAIGLFGLRKMGKTSVARAVQDRFTDGDAPEDTRGWAFAYADAERELDGGVEGLASALTAQLHHPRGGDKRPRHGLAGLRHEVEHLCRAGRPVCLIIDEHDLLIQGENAYAAGAVDLLRLLRALSQDRAHTVRVVLVGRQPDAVNAPRVRGQSNPTLNYFRPHWVGPLRRAASDALLRQLGEAAGLDFDGPALDQAWELAAGHPLMTRLYGSAVYQLALAAAGGPLAEGQSAAPFALAGRHALLRGHEARNHFAEVQDLLSGLQPAALALLGTLANVADPAARWAEADEDQPEDADLLKHFGLVEPGSGRVPGLLRHFLVPRPARQRMAEVA